MKLIRTLRDDANAPKTGNYSAQGTENIIGGKDRGILWSITAFVYKHKIPTEIAQDCSSAGRESNRKTPRCVLDSHSTEYVPRFYFLFQH